MFLNGTRYTAPPPRVQEKGEVELCGACGETYGGCDGRRCIPACMRSIIKVPESDCRQFVGSVDENAPVEVTRLLVSGAGDLGPNRSPHNDD